MFVNKAVNGVRTLLLLAPSTPSCGMNGSMVRLAKEGISRLLLPPARVHMELPVSSPERVTAGQHIHLLQLN